MKTTHSFSIDFIIRRCKDDRGQALIYARITVDEERKEISLKERINAADWDGKKEVVKGRTEPVKSLNQHIEEVRFKLKDKYHALCDKEAIVTAESVKQAYLGVHTQLKGHKLIELLDYYYKIWKPKLKPEASRMSTQPSSMLNGSLPEGNGLAKHVQRFKRIVNWAVEIKWISLNPFEKYSCSQKKTRRKKLTFPQLVAIEQQNFPDPTIHYVKELFLNSCYTGFAFADAMALLEEHFEWDTAETVWCKKYRIKSIELAAVPILRSAAVILNKYRNRPDFIKGGCIFPKITNQEVNRGLKIIQTVCGIDIPLTFHVARHTFAKTVALKNGIPLETV
jgi:integrase/recombinase XerD